MGFGTRGMIRGGGRDLGCEYKGNNGDGTGTLSWAGRGHLMANGGEGGGSERTRDMSIIFY